MEIDFFTFGLVDGGDGERSKRQKENGVMAWERFTKLVLIIKKIVSNGKINTVVHSKRTFPCSFYKNFASFIYPERVEGLHALFIRKNT